MAEQYNQEQDDFREPLLDEELYEGGETPKAMMMDEIQDSKEKLEIEPNKVLGYQLPKDEQLPEAIDYKYLDGLRGIGAFAVYLSHFFLQFYHEQSVQERDDGIDVVAPPDFLRKTPAKIVYHGYFWVFIFFILSGFVLSIRFFVTRKETCATGGTFRRYFRLVFPVLIILSLYYLTMKFDFYGETTFDRIKGKQFFNLLFDGLFGTWFGDQSWIDSTWTLSIELIGTYFIYLLSQTAVFYRGRFFIYWGVITYIWIMQILGYVRLVEIYLSPFIIHFPVFILGIFFADMESLPKRPLDKIRALSIWWKIPLNTALIAIFLTYGSWTGEGHCLTTYDEDCDFWNYTTLAGHIPKSFAMYAATISLFILALTSDWTQWVLETWPLQFLGRISYSLYLIHELFVIWMQQDSYNVFLSNGVENNLAILYVFLIYTPLLILVSWILEMIVDTPSKNIAYELDVWTRVKRPKPPKQKNDDTQEFEDPDETEYYNCWESTKRIWPIFAFILWLIVVWVSTEIFVAKNPRVDPNHPDEVQSGNHWTREYGQKEAKSNPKIHVRTEKHNFIQDMSDSQVVVWNSTSQTYEQIKSIQD